ncbi:MAG: glycosyltransferase family 39 protein [Acetatifactor sp.]|nr:glycosyltransferase family 39 protein [Acetatifactor sp.]
MNRPLTTQIYDQAEEQRRILYRVLPLAIMLLGAALRLVYLGSVPGGMHQDEAFSAWTAYSLLHNGIDSAGNFLPVYLAGWGDGQSALYSWLMIPLLAINGGKFGPVASRLPQALVAIATIWAVYCLARRMFGDMAAIWCSFLLAICPWHITMSRWGLEANLAPGFLIFGLYFFVRAMQNNAFLLLSALFYGLSLYCYATIWPVVPIILFTQIVYSLFHKKITLNRYSLGGVLLLALMALPLILFVIINTFDRSAIRLPFLTIPIMSGYRGGEVALSLSQMWSNLKRTGHLLLFQNVGTPYDILLPYGLFYDIGRIFIVIGFFCLAAALVRNLSRRQFCFEFLIFAQLLGSGVNCLLITANLQQINSLYIPLVLCEGYGVWCVLKWLKHFNRYLLRAVSALLAVAYLVFLVGFEYTYYTDYMVTVNAYFAQGVRECVDYAMEQSLERTDENGSHPYIVAERGAQWPRLLLFSGITGPEYLAHVTYKENQVEPATFQVDGITFQNGINYEHLDPNAIYIIYFTDAPVFEDNFNLAQFYDWYVAVPK